MKTLYVIAALLACSQCAARVFGSGIRGYTSVKDHGAVCNGTTDDAPAIRAALATGKDIFFPACAKPYLIASVARDMYFDIHFAFHLSSNQSIAGEPGSVIKAANGFINSELIHGNCMILMNHTPNNTIRGLTIDMNGANNLATSSGHFFSYAILGAAVTNVLIENNAIINNPGTNDIVIANYATPTVTSSHCMIRNNTNTNGGTSLMGNVNQLDFTSIYTACTDAIVSNNVIRSDHEPFAPYGGIEFHASRGRAVGNHITRVSVGTYISTDVPNQDIHDIEVTGNDFDFVLNCISFFATANPANYNRINIRKNNFRLSQFTTAYFTGQGAFGLIMPRDNTGVFAYTAILQNSRIEGNTCTDETRPPSSSQFFSIGATDTVTVRDNTISRLGTVAISILGTPFTTRRLLIEHNTITDFGMNTGAFNHEAIYMDLTGASSKPLKANYDASNVIIRDNIFAMSAATTKANVYFFDWNEGSAVTNLIVRGNRSINIGMSYKIGNRASSVTIYEARPRRAPVHAFPGILRTRRRP